MALRKKKPNAAATNSSKLTVNPRDPVNLISKLSPQEQQNFLVKLSNNEANLSACLNQRLDELNKPMSAIPATQAEPRTFQQLTKIAHDLTIKAQRNL